MSMRASRLTPVATKRCRGCGRMLAVGYFKPQRRVCKRCLYERRDLSAERGSVRKYRMAHRAELNAKQAAKGRVFYAWMDSFKEKPCADCGERYPSYVMDWDHVRGKKLFNIALLKSQWSKRGTKRLFLREIKKCDLVCSNCHRERTHQKHLKR